LEETLADGSLAWAKRGPGLGESKSGKEPKWMVVVDGQAVPIGADLDSTWPSEIKLLEATIEKIAVPRKVVVGRGKILSTS